MPARSRLRRGFTLLEVMTAVVILIILAALSVSFMVYGMGKARMNNAVFDVTAMINGAQLSAVSRGSPHYVFIYQTGNDLRIQVLDRPDWPWPVGWDWANVDLSNGPDAALAFTRQLEDGTVQNLNAPIRDQLVLSAGSGMDAGGLAFLDLDSGRIRKPLPAPFSAIALTSTATANPLDKPTHDLLAGCNFCVAGAGTPYGVLRFNADGTMRVMTGIAPSGAVIAFAPNTEDETGFAPKLLSISAPAGATVVF
ncbi:pilus assembly FimT family protein [Hyalangium versicolor]|uniref:pilus assembly FimT family protein n=1 Tax=Hyalangium versicolor TaxID=2861190 RepID=UPI001CCA307B|nr:prepilin-type N-terminal cleavage/methylation domain-containing protein [Hyalangium versicolor]